ncbi:MAG: bifunctional pyr operon transcriptional regulator/uracil phosphoribosyltransferase PyrR [Verrucomicrobiae bacterium]|nr:bifunctional pyr operon transcriptional regulator/uracil phosphoribosyltransferase PyrR [Verrucomicrobiae bacterium]
MAEQHLLMDSKEIAGALKRMAREIIERNGDCKDLVLLGVQRTGVTLAGRLARLLEKELGRSLPVGTLDVAMHRDDLDQRLAPHVHPTHIPGDITGKVVVLVDDVLYSGRTTRAALDALADFGRPRKVQLAVLVDRGHRELPIRADFVGKNVPTAPKDHIEMRLDDQGGEDAVYLIRP